MREGGDDEATPTQSDRRLSERTQSSSRSIVHPALTLTFTQPQCGLDYKEHSC